MPRTNVFETDFFVGGNGMFLQYYDVVKPVYLYAVLKMLIENNTYGLPDILSTMSIPSLVEWYKNRRYINPLKQMDYKNAVPDESFDIILNKILAEDPTLYKLAPPLNIMRMLYVYKSQYMTFPFIIYTEEYSKAVENDVKEIFSGVPHKYAYDGLENAIKKCDENFTYIFSDLEVLKDAADILKGTYSHILLANDYRYNYIDGHETLKYDMKDLMFSHPFIRTGLTSVWEGVDYNQAFDNIIFQGGGQ